MSRQRLPNWKRDASTRKFAIPYGDQLSSPELLKYPDLCYLLDDRFHVERQANTLTFEPSIKESIDPRDPHYLLNK